ILNLHLNVIAHLLSYLMFVLNDTNHKKKQSVLIALLTGGIRESLTLHMIPDYIKYKRKISYFFVLAKHFLRYLFFVYTVDDRAKQTYFLYKLQHPVDQKDLLLKDSYLWHMLFGKSKRDSQM